MFGKRRKNPVAQFLRKPHFRSRVLPDKREKERSKTAWQEIVEYLRKINGFE